MRKGEQGDIVPSTLGEYRDLCDAIGGNDCAAVKFLDEKIAKQGRDAVVVCGDNEMRTILFPMLLKK